MDLNTDFEYVAFISYDHSNTKIASKVQTKLEHYVVPGSVRKNLPGLPKHVRPIFRDDTDMGGGPLRETLKKELSKSKYLIVICSPESAKSSWVNDEVKIFRELGREKFIIPVIVAGEAHSEDKDDECFCPQLLGCLNSENDELIGLNVCKQGLEKVIIQILSLILDVDFKVLWNREGFRKRRKKIRVACNVLILTIIVLGLVWYLMPTYKYYSDYVEQWGIPIGINELDNEIRSHKKFSYRFKYGRIPIGQSNALTKRVEEVSIINSNGIIIENPQRELSTRYSITRYIYSPQSGNLKEVVSCDAMGNELFRQRISSNQNHLAAIYDLVGTNDEGDSGYLNSYTAFSPKRTNVFDSPKSSIKRIVYERDSLGFRKSVSFHSNNSDDINLSKTADANGAFGQSFKTDSLGRITEMSLLDEKGNCINGITGIGKIRLSYVGNYVSTIENFDCEGQPVIDENLIFKTTNNYDRYGNLIEERYWGTNNLRTYNIDMISGMQAKYDEYGNCNTINMLNANDGTIVDKYGVNKISFTYDSKGRTTRIEYTDNANFYVYGKDGYAAIELKYYNNTVLPKQIKYYGINNKLMRNIQGIAYIERDIDNNGRVCAEKYYDDELRRTTTNINVSKIKYEYDSKGLLKNVLFYNETDAPCKDIYDVYGGKYVYDQRGNIVQYTNLGIHGDPIESKNGVAIINMMYDISGRLIERSYFGSNNLPVVDNESKVHKLVYEYGPWGLCNRISSYDVNDSLCLNSEGFAVALYEANSPGCITRTSFFDKTLTPVNNIYGVSCMEATYTQNKFQTSLNFYDKHHVPVDNPDGVSMLKSSYDTQGRQISFEMYDSNGHLFVGKEGYAKIINSYDEHGLLLLTEYYNGNNKLTNNKNGYARRIRKYDATFNLLEEYTTDANNKLAMDSIYKRAKFVLSYDFRGNLIKRQAFGPDSQPIKCSYGYATWIARYSKDGRQIGTQILDENNKEIKSFNGILTKTNQFAYNKEYFKYNLFDSIIGFVCVIIFIIIVIMGIKNSSSITISCAMIFAGIGFIMITDFIMYNFSIPKTIYNNSWIFIILCIIACLYFTVMFTLNPLKGHLVSLYKEWQHKTWISKWNWYKRLYKYNDMDLGTTIALLMVETWLIIMIYWFSVSMIEILTNKI